MRFSFDFVRSGLSRIEPWWYEGTRADELVAAAHDALDRLEAICEVDRGTVRDTHDAIGTVAERLATRTDAAIHSWGLPIVQPDVELAVGRVSASGPLVVLVTIRWRPPTCPTWPRPGRSSGARASSSRGICTCETPARPAGARPADGTATAIRR